MPRVLLLDNYDSFTFNLAHLMEQVLGERPTVIRNDQIGPDEARTYDALVLSPGPGIPREAGRMPEIVRSLIGMRPILGVCLGHQCLGEILGGTLVNLERVYHGKQETVSCDPNSALFAGLPEQILVGRYHSWVVDPGTLPGEVHVSATDNNHSVMALEVRTRQVYGVQFHPESVMTEHGERMIANFFAEVRA